MPVYNTWSYVREAIESILLQTLQDFEYIIIDDASTDCSMDILREYAQRDSRIRLYAHTENKGISATRNEAIKRARAPYIATQDSDDISAPNRLEKLFTFLESYWEYAAVGSDNEIIDSTGNKIGVRRYETRVDRSILKSSPISNPASMFRTEVFMGLWWYRSGLDYGEDYDLWLNMYLHGYKLGNIPEYLVKLRLRDGQTKSEKIKETLKNTIYLQEYYIQQWITPSLSDRFYIFLEKLLLFFPSTWIWYLFKKITYRYED